MMKTFCVRMLLAATALACLAGCGTAQIYTTRAATMRDPKAPRLQTLLASEEPAIVVYLPKHCGWGQQVGSVWVEEAVSGRDVWHQSEFMREGSRYYFLPENLSPGTFLAVLRAEGERVAMTNFDVR